LLLPSFSQKRKLPNSSASLSTIRRWRKAGTLSTFRVGDILRYRIAVLEEFIAAHSGPNTGEK
jgi:hypothetical protein